ncbi:MAG: hypothetical protein R8M38_09770 [Mariprofundaceae bacterium]
MTLRTLSPLIACLLLYAALFSLQEKESHTTITSGEQLAVTLPLPIQQAVSGYLRQLQAELLLIRVAVYLGGQTSLADTSRDTGPLVHYFHSITTLHPKLFDSYYLAESSLSWIDEESARNANTLLTVGMEALPTKWVLYFFAGFNHFSYLNEPLKASTLLWQASQIDHAAAWLAHLASALAAEGGDIIGGLGWLRMMEASNDGSVIKKTYQNDIVEYEKAVSVLKAIQIYRAQTGTYPDSLNILVPHFIISLPEISDKYILIYQKPKLIFKKKGR